MWSQYLNVTGRQTDGQTTERGITALCVASRGNDIDNCLNCIMTLAGIIYFKIQYIYQIQYFFIWHLKQPLHSLYTERWELGRASRMEWIIEYWWPICWIVVVVLSHLFTAVLRLIHSLIRRRPRCIRAECSTCGHVDGWWRTILVLRVLQ